MQGKYAEAEPLHELSQVVRAKFYVGPERLVVSSTNAQQPGGLVDPFSLLVSCASLDETPIIPSFSFPLQGNYTEAELLLEQCQATKDENLVGPDHPYVATTFDNLGMLLSSCSCAAQSTSIHLYYSPHIPEQARRGRVTV